MAPVGAITDAVRWPVRRASPTIQRSLRELGQAERVKQLDTNCLKPLDTFRLREQLRGDGTLVEEAGPIRLTRNYSFDSPSAAATIIVGSNRNGPATWKDHMNRSLATNRAATTGAPI